MSLYSQVVLDDRPNAYWRLADLVDASGNGNTLSNPGGGANPGAGPSLLSGDTDASKDFDGTNDFLTAADDADLDLGDTLTLEAWVRIDSAPVTNGYLISKGTNGYALRVDSSLVVEFTKQGAGVIVTSTVALGIGTAHHIVVTKDGATVKLYVDGVDRTGVVSNLTLANTAAVLTIGAPS